MKILVYLWLVCSSWITIPAMAQQHVTEESKLRDIVFMRTEGLVMVQLMEKYATDKNMLSICKRYKSYYEKTQPILLQVVEGKALELNKSQFEMIRKGVEKQLKKHDVQHRQAWNDLFQQHLQANIGAYMTLLKEYEWESVRYFSFEALPGLLNVEQQFLQTK